MTILTCRHGMPPLLFYASAGPAVLSFKSYGILFVVTVLIESAAFARLLGIGWKRSLVSLFQLNLICIIAAYLLGLYLVTIPSFLSTRIGSISAITTLCIGLAVIMIPLYLNHPPRWFYVVILGTIALGVLVTELFCKFGLPPPPPSRLTVLLIVVSTALTGLGISLLIKGILIRMFFRQKGIWTILPIANCLSTLALLPFLAAYSPNPYWDSIMLSNGQEPSAYLDRASDPDEMVRDLQSMQASNLYLLGLSKNSRSQSSFACAELRLLETRFPTEVGLPVRLSLGLDPETAMLVSDYALENSKLILAHRAYLEWIKTHLGYWVPVRNAIETDDQETLDSVYPSWVQWFETNPAPWREGEFASTFYGAMPSPAHPRDAVRRALQQLESECEMPQSRMD